MIFRNKLLHHVTGAGMAAAAAIAVSGCAGLLPETKQQTRTPWHSYAEAQSMFDRIEPGKTSLAELKAFGVDPGQTPNVAYLGPVDLLRRLLPSSSFDLDAVDPGLRECMKPEHNCFAYEIEQLSLDRHRYGSFWLDFFNFKRQVNVTGWQFDAVVVIRGETVVYKHWSGKPNLEQQEEERSPLGPLQGFGSTMLHR